MHTFTVLHLWQEEEYFQHETFMQSGSLRQSNAYCMSNNWKKKFCFWIHQCHQSFFIILSQTFQIKWTLRYCRKQLFCSLQWIKSKGERNSVMDTDTRTLTLDVCVCMTSILPVKPPFKSSLHSPLFSGKSNSAAAVESNKPIMTIYGQKSCSFALLWQSIKTDHLLENTGWPKIDFVHWNGYEFENEYFLSHFGDVKMYLQSL